MRRYEPDPSDRDRPAFDRLPPGHTRKLHQPLLDRDRPFDGEGPETAFVERSEVEGRDFEAFPARVELDAGRRDVTR